MHPVVSKLYCLALFACVLALTAQESEAVSNKVSHCCKTVSTKKINIPILGYRKQERNPPCVKAVIFTTTEGEYCAYGKMAWVQDKMRALQAAKLNTSVAAPPTL